MQNTKLSKKKVYLMISLGSGLMAISDFIDPIKARPTVGLFAGLYDIIIELLGPYGMGIVRILIAIIFFVYYYYERNE